MKAIVFGSTGFIGSHVVEQLHLAGHQVTTVVRQTSDTSFLQRLGVNVVPIDFSHPQAIGNVINGHDVVYNCTASATLQSPTPLEEEVEIKLTRKLVEAAASQGAARFIQLSTIVIYDFRSNDPLDESYQSEPEYPIQQVGIERERVVEEAGRQTGITTIILRPASTIGVRDKKSFFARMFTAHAHDQYPMVGQGAAKVSLVDTRDIGRAMVWLGTYRKPDQDNGVYLLKGFDTTWHDLKQEIDRATGRISRTIDLATDLSEEEMRRLQVNPFALKTLSVNRLWNDRKIRTLGFETKYTLTEAVDAAVNDLLTRNRA
ncbi:NAD(P)-dependent oxidoreductase [Brevibacillus sp. SYP-B805]|uniref:NAD-dependent epimerase/dehydratase family protein n=1 Tax=Brevibacillus sp. SYP-B805 TaxID=1578199 RepID=UPI0013EB83C9|nr:NAD(P)-dependent oxidoreductase [Brevibacillus sp. SYP-B805]NGQ95828.1 NAD(P)-dependent oxidoreductase [Brevibacillus sp. SYP-B805]